MSHCHLCETFSAHVPVCSNLKQESFCVILCLLPMSLSIPCLPQPLQHWAPTSYEFSSIVMLPGYMVLAASGHPQPLYCNLVETMAPWTPAHRADQSSSNGTINDGQVSYCYEGQTAPSFDFQIGRRTQ